MSRRTGAASVAAPTAAPPSAPPPGLPEPSPRALLALVVLGAASALWAAFLWWELIVLRSGGTPFCALGGGVDCAAVWDSAFASQVQRLTGLPVAAWGVAWGLVATALPLMLRARLARQRADAGETLSGTRLCAAAGVVTVFVMAGVSLSERALCLGCLGTYALVLGYAAIALGSFKRFGLPQAGRGAGLFGALTLGAFVLLLFPAGRTPQKGDAAGRAAVAAAAAAHPPVSASPAAATAPVATAEVKGPVADFIRTLPATQVRALSDALGHYRAAEPRALPPARALVGPAGAPVRITEFTDVLCSHCADLHETLETLRQQLPPGSFVVEPRQFPLDGECNSEVQMRGAPVRCLAAKALICMEGRPEAQVYAGVLFARQRQLQPDLVFELASPYIARAQLERCVADPATQKKLDADVALAKSYDISGTPLVLVNGRKGSAGAAFLYTMALTKGSPDDPGFALLPPSDPGSHAH